MRFDWLQYLDLALELSEQAKRSKHREANLRSSISRAYYATFHKSRQHLEGKWGIPVHKNSLAHQQVAEEFAKRQNTDELMQGKRESISENLTRMRKNRIRADYWEKCENLEEIARDNIKTAKQVLSDLRRL